MWVNSLRPERNAGTVINLLTHCRMAGSWKESKMWISNESFCQHSLHIFCEILRDWFQWAWVNILFRQWLGTTRVPFYQHGLTLFQYGQVITCPMKYGWNYLSILKRQRFHCWRFAMDKWLHHTLCGWNYLSIPKRHRFHCWSFGMDKQLHPTLYQFIMDVMTYTCCD